MPLLLRALAGTVAGAVLLIGSGSAAAQADAQALHTRALAATCANCHGTEGNAVQGEAMARIAGLSKDYIATQLKAFRDGTRQATVMHQLAKGYSDQQLEAVAAYFAAQKARPE